MSFLNRFEVVFGAGCILAMAAAPGCKHAPTPAAPVVQSGAPMDPALLNAVDLRLLGEAIAYDVSHAPWLAAYQDRLKVEPQICIADVPDRIPPAAFPFDAPMFVGILEQALRNTHALTVVPHVEDSAPAQLGTPPWRLDVSAHASEDEVEGQRSRVYMIHATVRAVAGGPSAFEKDYPLRKRVHSSNHEHTP
jgi:hypothetical protein